MPVSEKIFFYFRGQTVACLAAPLAIFLSSGCSESNSAGTDNTLPTPPGIDEGNDAADDSMGETTGGQDGGNDGKAQLVTKSATTTMRARETRPKRAMAAPK